MARYKTSTQTTIFYNSCTSSNLAIYKAAWFKVSTTAAHHIIFHFVTQTRGCVSNLQINGFHAQQRSSAYDGTNTLQMARGKGQCSRNESMSACSSREVPSLQESVRTVAVRNHAVKCLRSEDSSVLLAAGWHYSCQHAVGATSPCRRVIPPPYYWWFFKGLIKTSTPYLVAGSHSTWSSLEKGICESSGTN